MQLITSHDKKDSDGKKMFIVSNQVDKTCSSTLISASYQSLLLVYLKVCMESLNPELALYGSKNMCARTEVSTGAVSLK